jgi:hypothetical protein
LVASFALRAKQRGRRGWLPGGLDRQPKPASDWTEGTAPLRGRTRSARRQANLLRGNTMRAAFKKHSIPGDNNPCWTLAEPILLQIWAEGILSSTYLGLQLVNLFSLIVSIFFFLLGTTLRLMAAASLLFLAFLIFPETLSTCFNLLFSDWTPNYIVSNAGSQWLYVLLGYAILIKSILFVLGSNFSDLVRDTVIQISLMLTNMVPLKLIARGLQKENFLAQAVAKTAFMGVYIVQTMTATPMRFQREWDKVFDLYLKSNRPSERDELERIAERFAKGEFPGGGEAASSDLVPHPSR